MPDDRAGLPVGIGSFQKARTGSALRQCVNTLLPYIGLWIAMILLLRRGVPYPVVLAVALVAGAFLVRVFILFHDCCHGCFFPSERANAIVGFLLGVVTFTPYTNWRIGHILHHATSSDLDRRGLGDVWLMTVAEYRDAPWRTRLCYRLYRNPLVMFLLGPLAVFFITQRLPNQSGGRRGLPSVLLTNLAILAVAAGASLAMGFTTYLLIQVSVLFLGGIGGVWLFYVQHDFDGVWWARHEGWSFRRAAFEGSSYYKLPKILQWLSGNIGLHHIHHLRPKIPNYRLQAAYDAIPELREVRPLTIRRSLKSLWLNLWDEEGGRMVSFRSLRRAAA